MPGLFGGVVLEVGGAITGSLESCDSNDVTQCITQSFTDDSTTCGRHNSIGITCSTGEWVGTVGYRDNVVVVINTETLICVGSGCYSDVWACVGSVRISYV